MITETRHEHRKHSEAKEFFEKLEIKLNAAKANFLPWENDLLKMKFRHANDRERKVVHVGNVDL